MSIPWPDLRAYYGLRKPYDFRAAIPFLLSIILLSLITLSAIIYTAFGKLSFGTPRSSFFIYLFLLSLLAGILSRHYKSSTLLICLFVLDFGLGFGTRIFGLGFGTRIFGTNSLLPSNYITSGFKYHPILQAVPIPNIQQRGGLSNQKLFKHNSAGNRGEEIGPLESKILILAFGGSTTYEIYVGEGETWVEKLNQELGDPYKVVNFGVPGYSSSEHVMQTAFYEDVNGKYPNCSLYYVGWNDIRNSHIPNLDRAYADFHLISQHDNLETRKLLKTLNFSPLFSIAIRYVSGWLDTVPPSQEFSKFKPRSGPDPNLERIFVKNVSTISAINRSRGVKTVFLGQILDPHQLVSETVDKWTPLLTRKDIWPIQRHLNDLLEIKATELGDAYINAGVDNFTEADFLDYGHFSASGSAKFAHLILYDIKKYCQNS